MLWRPTVGTSETLGCSFTLDDILVTTGWGALDKTKKNLLMHIPMTSSRQGKSFQFDFAGEVKTTGKIEVGGVYFYGTPVKSIEQSA
jgi:hypothetical protein